MYSECTLYIFLLFSLLYAVIKLCLIIFISRSRYVFYQSREARDGKYICRIIERSMNVTICTPYRDKNRSTLRETEKNRAWSGVLLNHHLMRQHLLLEKHFVLENRFKSHSTLEVSNSFQENISRNFHCIYLLHINNI